MIVLLGRSWSGQRSIILQYRRNKVKFSGVIISKDSIEIDPERCAAIVKMPVPKDRKAVLRFLGMVKYVSTFVPNLSLETEHLHALTRKGSKFEWSAKHQDEYEKLKKALIGAPALQIFNKELPITIQTDASKSGIGACLMQQGQPVAYASRALTAVEKNYAPIEKELLAIVFGFEKFHPYVYGTSVTVVTDHKPLVNILAKSFTRISARLQRLKLRLLKYRFEVTYTQGKNMFIADALSRAYVEESSPDQSYLSFTLHACTMLVMSDTKAQQWRKATESPEIVDQWGVATG